ncbi:maestro heat-like repeat-containing protein family member 7 isoform X2 [Dromaius novaehollandiae]|uniref:maestro heat-like repeat-containing protein family member 7 isoform X2 n=1 Tax=Dromaius novaehollandiae TaxID=8790 RepID=UPI003120127C
MPSPTASRKILTLLGIKKKKYMPYNHQHKYFFIKLFLRSCFLPTSTATHFILHSQKGTGWMEERPPRHPGVAWEEEEEDGFLTCPKVAWQKKEDGPSRHPRVAWEKKHGPPRNPRVAWEKKEDGPPRHPRVAWEKKEDGPPRHPRVAWGEKEEDGPPRHLRVAWEKKEDQPPTHPRVACEEQKGQGPPSHPGMAWEEKEDGPPSHQKEEGEKEGSLSHPTVAWAEEKEEKEGPPSQPTGTWQEEEQEDGPPSCTTVTREEEDGGPPESSSQLEQCVPQPLPTGSTPPGEEEEALARMHAFFRHRGKLMEEAQKLLFLASICTLCRVASTDALVWDKLFLCKVDLAKTIEVLLQEEPTDHLCTAVRQQAMLTIAAMSKVKLVLEDNQKNSLLHSCFCSVFYLPLTEDMQSLQTSLFSKTLAAMDSMLQMLVLTSPTSALLELQSILQVLLPFTQTKRAAVRERAVGRLAKLSQLLVTSSLLKVCCHFERSSDGPDLCRRKHFSVLGQLVGCLTLCCAYEDQGTRHGAADALHHLYAFILQRESMQLSQDSPKHLQLQEAWQDANTCLAPSKSVSEITTTFSKCLQPSERTDIILTAIRGMRSFSAYDTQAAAHMLDVLVTDDASQLEQVPEIVRCVCRSLVSIPEVSARHSLNRALLALTCAYPDEVVMSLLHCSPSCNSAAKAMWRVMVSEAGAAEKVLRELLSVLEDWAPCKTSISDGDHTGILSLAASRVLHAILRQPICPPEVQLFFPQLLLALLFQISFALEMVPEEVAIFWGECQQDWCAPSSPIRCTVEALKALLCSASYESRVLAMERKGAWDMLLTAETHHRGVAVLAREMTKAPRPQRAWIFHQLAALLSREEPSHEIPAMAFLVELLVCADLSGEDKRVLKLFQRHLQSQSTVMRGLVLRGLLMLCKRPEMARKVQALLPVIMECLQDADRDTCTKALVGLNNMLHLLDDGQRASPITLQLAQKLLPLLDDESSCVRKLSIQLLKDVMEMVVGTARQQMEQQVQRSLLPLFFHLHDQVQSVAQASQEALVEAAKFLKWEQLRYLTETSQTWRIGECLLARNRSRAGEYLCQSLLYLESPQKPLQEAAVRFLGLVGQHLRDQGEEKLQDIYKAFQPLQQRTRSSIRSLVVQTILIQRAPRTKSPSRANRGTLPSRIRSLWERWQRALAGSCICCWSSAPSTGAT